ncbi:MAG TPA: thioredoxin [Candidatus Rhabdochlamydia sp.]|jgi:thioredoxin 1|nr:thioredoxin [Candidatus Rhabdochlamydia sp.]
MSEFIKEILEDDFDKETNQGTVLIDFFADWCGPCRQLTPILEEVAKEVKEVNFIKINIDAAQEVAARLEITSIPTLILFHKGKEIDRFVGLIEADDLKTFLKKAK